MCAMLIKVLFWWHWSNSSIRSDKKLSNDMCAMLIKVSFWCYWSNSNIRPWQRTYNCLVTCVHDKEAVPLGGGVPYLLGVFAQGVTTGVTPARGSFCRSDLRNKNNIFRGARRFCFLLAQKSVFFGWRGVSSFDSGPFAIRGNSTPSLYRLNYWFVGWLVD